MDDERNQPPKQPQAPRDTEGGFNQPAEPADVDNSFADPVDASSPNSDIDPNQPPAFQPYYEPNRTTRRQPSPLQSEPDPAAEVSLLMRLGWILLGMLIGILSILVVFVLYRRRDPALFKVSLRYVLIGFGIGLFIEILLLQSVLGGSLPQTTIDSSSPGWTSTTF